MTRTSTSSPDDLTSSTFSIFLCLSGSYSSFSPASSPTRECLVLLRSHGETTGNRFFAKQLTSSSSSLSSLSHQDGYAAFQPGRLRLGSGGAGRRYHTGTCQFPLNSYSFFLLNLMSALCFPTLCSYLVSWKTQDPHRQKRRRSPPSPLSVYLRNKQVRHSVFSLYWLPTLLSALFL